MKNKRVVSLFSLLIFCACSHEKTDAIPHQETNRDTLIRVPAFTKKTDLAQKDSPKEIETEELQPIIDNFKRINAIEKWTNTVKIDFEETTEGGEADFCYQNGKLEKIVCRQFGETFRKVTEFYLLNEELSFVFEETSRYNRPIYWDSIAMVDSGDDQVWDEGKSEIIQLRSYFLNGVLNYQSSNNDNNKLHSTMNLKTEQKRIKGAFAKLLSAAGNSTKFQK